MVDQVFPLFVLVQAVRAGQNSNCSRMRVLWISCLLIGSIICAPVDYDYGFDMEYEDLGTYPMQEGAFYYDHSQEGANYEPDNSYDYMATASSASPRSYRSNKMAGGDWFSSGYTGGNRAHRRADRAPIHSAPDTSGEETQPVFSDVSGLEPVYTTGSRSRYQRGRAVFAQTRYIPTESIGLPVPLFPYSSYTLSQQGNV